MYETRIYRKRMRNIISRMVEMQAQGINTIAFSSLTRANSQLSPRRKSTICFRGLCCYRLHIRVAGFGTKGSTKRTHTNGVAKSRQGENQVPRHCISRTLVIHQLDN